MTDIINRLRDLAAVSTWLVAVPPVMMKAAADEIERLRDRVAKDEALLRQTLDFLECRSMGAEHLIATLRTRMEETK